LSAQPAVAAPTRPQGLEKWVPGVRAVRTYERDWLRRDLVAAIILAALLVPQGMASAELAGLPAITGLYTTVACLLAYAVFGPSPYLILGPDSPLSPSCSGPRSLHRKHLMGSQSMCATSALHPDEFMPA
jgi:hypothetical protein